MSDDGDLADDSDVALSSKLGGMLTFEDNNDQETADSSYSGSTSLLSFESEGSPSSGDIPDGRRPSGTRIVFEVVSARTVNNIRKKYVAYTLLVKRSPGLDRFPAIIERRYSDFLELFLNLKKHYPPELQSVNYFPKKTVLGNFKPEVITSRSRAFEQFLYHIYDVDKTRLSEELAEFFYNREVRDAHGCMRCGKFEDAIPLLENAYFLQEKVLGDSHLTTLSTLCEVIATHNAIDNMSEAHKFAEVALCQFVAGHQEKCELYPPLLQLSVRLCWALGKDKRDLEQRLQSLSQSGTRVEKLPTLLDVVMKKCK